MFCMETDVTPLVEALKDAFGTRLIYVGLQGSYLRGEAKESSDVDIMLVLEEVRQEDLDAYRVLLSRMSWGALSCGFVCGRAELACWNRLEVLHLLNSTKDLYGTLGSLVPAYTAEDVRQYVKLSAGNLYHELCHRYLYTSRENSVQKLPASCKAVFFILQDQHWLRTGRFAATKGDLLPLLSGTDKDVFELSIELAAGKSYDFDAALRLLLSWCQMTLKAA